MSEFERLKDQLMVDGVEESVSVNTRHLIDKILARYSAQYTVYRELIQNANDAGASIVQIHFDTTENLWRRSVTSIRVRNNGKPFSEIDLVRLRRIAEGNPDETKIGFFGVVSSEASLAEEPLLTSGSTSLAFLWRGDALYTKRGSLPTHGTLSEWTSFFLKLREPIEVPNESFGSFLVSLLAFVNCVKRIEVFENEKRVFCVDRKASIPKPIALNYGYFTLKQSLFTLKEFSFEKIQFDVEAKTRSTVYMRVATVSEAHPRPR